MPLVDHEISRKSACFSHLVNSVYRLSSTMMSHQLGKKKKISQSKMRLEPGGGEWKKLMKTVGGTECRDEREVTAASGQQMLWL